MSKVHWLSPYRQDKNIGLAINEAIKDLRTNENDWIVLTDYDVLFLLPESKSVIIDILRDTEYDILGAVTNRISMPNQLIPGVFNEWDILKHIGYARQILDAHGTKVRPVQDILAAFCLCFRVETWRKLGGFQENSIQFDIMFSLAAMRAKMKLGVMEGVYVFHLYRPLSDNASMDTKHLEQIKK